MKQRKRRQHSLEDELKKLGSEKFAKDPRGRTRAQILAATLWNKSLLGDRESLKLLLDRLPEATPQPEPETPATKTASTRDPQDYQSVTNAFRAMVEAGIVPIEVFERFKFDKVAESLQCDPDATTKTVQ